MDKIKLVFATNNNKKIIEANTFFARLNCEVLSLKDVNLNVSIPEDHDTLEQNSAQKARFVYDLIQSNCFADDSGLEVETLNWAPGAFSSRYAGDNATDLQNMEKLLHELGNKMNRMARFKTIITLIYEGKIHQFEGIITGKIISEPRGSSGFGYDPLFIPDGYDKTFAELSLEEKNSISHRARALRKMYTFLQLSS